MSLVLFFNDTPTPEIYTLSLHDALPISCSRARTLWYSMATASSASAANAGTSARWRRRASRCPNPADRKSTRLNSSHLGISYAVFCLKKKKQKHKTNRYQRKKRYVMTDK